MTKNPLLYWLLPIGAALLEIALIPFNLYLWQMPEWIMIILACITAGTNVLLWWKRKKKYIRKALLLLFCLIATAISLFGAYCSPYWNSVSFQSSFGYTKPYDTVLTYQEARSDLDYAWKYLKKVHPACYHGVPQEVKTNYLKAIEHLKAADAITVTMLASEIESFLSPLKDAHTSYQMMFEDWHYMKYIETHNQAGDVLTTVNGMSLPQLLEQNASRISYETDEWAIHQVGNCILTAEGLAYLGIPTKDGVRYIYQSPSGNTTEEFVLEDDFLTWEYYASYNHFSNEEVLEESFVSYQIDPEHNAAVLTLTSCINNEEYQKCLQEMFTEISQQEIENVVVDLRYNGGGDSSVANEFIRYLDVDSYKIWASDLRLGCFYIHNPQQLIENPRHEELMFGGNLYLLTSTQTFSSAMNFAQYVKDNHMGTIIGAASGNAPDSYGDISIFSLPHSGILISVSTKKWYRIDNLPGLIEPDLPCDSNDIWEYLWQQL